MLFKHPLLFPPDRVVCVCVCVCVSVCFNRCSTESWNWIPIPVQIKGRKTTPGRWLCPPTDSSLLHFSSRDLLPDTEEQRKTALDQLSSAILAFFSIFFPLLFSSLKTCFSVFNYSWCTVQFPEGVIFVWKIFSIVMLLIDFKGEWEGWTEWPFSQPCEPLSSFFLSITLTARRTLTILLATSVTQQVKNEFQHLYSPSRKRHSQRVRGYQNSSLILTICIMALQ